MSDVFLNDPRRIVSITVLDYNRFIVVGMNVRAIKVIEIGGEPWFEVYWVESKFREPHERINAKQIGSVKYESPAFSPKED